MFIQITNYTMKINSKYMFNNLDEPYVDENYKVKIFIIKMCSQRGQRGDVDSWTAGGGATGVNLARQFLET